ncbi:MAG: sporulation protein YunB [Clostridiales bacterium]|nr:sporulation protein YunB [Clostridiales bacterium]
MLFVGIILFYHLYIQPVIRTVSKEEIKDSTVHAVNTAVTGVMSSTTAFTDLTEIVKDSEGNIVLIRANTASINLLARMVTEHAQQNLSTMADKGISIPIGSLTGIAFLAGRGPYLKMKAVTVGTVDTSFSSQFLHAGINQTLHKIFINVTASISIIIPGASNKVTSTVQVMVSESILIGKVPDVYFNSSVADALYNLVP